MAGQQGREVVIVEAVRTPIGRGHREKGYYKDIHPNDLLGKTYTEVLQRSGVDPAEVEDVIAGCVQQFGEQAFNVARNAWLQEGLPIEAAATTVDRQCGSAQQAVELRRGAHRVRHPRRGDRLRRRAHGPPALRGGHGDPAGVRRGLHPEAHGEAQHRRPGPGRRDDRRPVGDPALRARRARRAARTRRPARATEQGWFEREIVPFQVNGDTYVADQGIRPDTSLEALAKLKPAFKPDGKITAGNCVADLRRRRRGAAHVAARRPTSSGSRPRARIVDQTTVGCDPVKMLEGPIPATAKLLKRNGHDDRRHRLHRDQRGVRAGRRRLVARARPRHGPRQPPRRGDGPRPPARLDRRAAASRRCCTSSRTTTRSSAS